MIISTMNDLPGYDIQEVHGEVFGLTVRSRNVGLADRRLAQVDGRRRAEGHDEDAGRGPRPRDGARRGGGRGEGRERDPRVPLRHLRARHDVDGDLRVRRRSRRSSGRSLPGVQLDGIHHITAITGDAPRNVDFYTRVLGPAAVAKTVNQDDPASITSSTATSRRPGADMTFFEYRRPESRPGGRGMVHGSSGASAAGGARLLGRRGCGAEGGAVERAGTRCASPIRRASATSWSSTERRPGAHSPSTRRSRRSTPAGFEGVRAYSHAPDRTAELLER